MQATAVTWALIVFGVITLLPLVAAQLSILINPDSRKTTDLLVGKGENWRDTTHFRMAVGSAWADWLFFVPLFFAGIVGIALGRPWGYVLFGTAGACSLYINIILWFTEREYVYPSRSRSATFTSTGRSGSSNRQELARA